MLFRAKWQLQRMVAAGVLLIPYLYISVKLHVKRTVSEPNLNIFL